MGGKNGSQNCSEGTDNSGNAVSDDDGGIYRQRAGSRLRDRRDIEHFVFLQPLELFHVFLFHKGDNDKTAAKSAGAQDEHGFKQTHSLL